MNALRNEILQELLPPRDGRFTPRGLKRKMASYPIRRSRSPTQTRSLSIRLFFPN